MLNFFTTSNGFRSTLPVVSNLTAMNVWDGVCMCFIYASLLEFVCVNYVGRKRPLHNVVYRPGENPVTQVLLGADPRHYSPSLCSWILSRLPFAAATGLQVRHTSPPRSLLSSRGGSRMQQSSLPGAAGRAAAYLWLCVHCPARVPMPSRSRPSSLFLLSSSSDLRHASPSSAPLHCSDPALPARDNFIPSVLSLTLLLPAHLLSTPADNQ